jgi:hypothetical protein
MRLNFCKFCMYAEWPRLLWFRVMGYGLLFKRGGLLFSERNRIKGITAGDLHLRILTRGD